VVEHEASTGITPTSAADVVSGAAKGGAAGSRWASWARPSR
jgi:hypothetical protein